VFAFVSLNGNGYAFLNQEFNILSAGERSPLPNEINDVVEWVVGY